MSRAMRNRGIELFMLSDPHQSSPQAPRPQQPARAVLQSSSSSGLEAATEASGLVLAELEAVLSGDGVPGWQAPACLAAAHLDLVQQAAKTHRFAQQLCSTWHDPCKVALSSHWLRQFMHTRHGFFTGVADLSSGPTTMSSAASHVVNLQDKTLSGLRTAWQNCSSPCLVEVLTMHDIFAMSPVLLATYIANENDLSMPILAAHAPSRTANVGR